MSSADRLIVILNDEKQPPTTFTNRNIGFATPNVDETSEDGRWNTRLTVDSVPGRGYYGTRDIFYLRVAMSSLGSLDIRSETGFTHDQIVTMINNLLGASIGVDELEPIDIPEIELDESKIITLTAKPESLGWYGSTDITLTYGRPYLMAVVADRLLNVLTHGINNVNGLPYAKELAFNLDFSSYRDALKRTPSTLLPVDIPALQSVTAGLGFPDWNSGRLTDYPTAQIADSNKSFDRVAVVDINSNGMVGPFYFHYNLFDEK